MCICLYIYVFIKKWKKLWNANGTVLTLVTSKDKHGGRREILTLEIKSLDYFIVMMIDHNNIL